MLAVANLLLSHVYFDDAWLNDHLTCKLSGSLGMETALILLPMTQETNSR